MQILKIKNKHQKPVKPIIYQMSCPFCGTIFRFDKTDVKEEKTSHTFREYGKDYTSTKVSQYLECPNPKDRGRKIFLPDDEKQWIGMIVDKKQRQKAEDEAYPYYD